METCRISFQWKVQGSSHQGYAEKTGNTWKNETHFWGKMMLTDYFKESLRNMLIIFGNVWTYTLWGRHVLFKSEWTSEEYAETRVVEKEAVGKQNRKQTWGNILVELTGTIWGFLCLSKIITTNCILALLPPSKFNLSLWNFMHVLSCLEIQPQAISHTHTHTCY